MTDLQALSPCPGCGSEPLFIECGERWYAACSSIDCRWVLGEGYDRDAIPAHSFATEAEAIAAWNSRAPESPWRPISEALAALIQWHERATADDDCEYLNGSGWDDAAKLVIQARAYLATLPTAPGEQP